MEKYKMEKKLIHEKIKDGLWKWKCPLCSKELIHRTDGSFNRMSNLQTKGAMSRHLMAHDYNLVQHGRSVTDSMQTEFVDGKWIRKKNIDRRNKK